MSDQGETKTTPAVSGMAPLAQTREQSIVDSVKSSVEFQKQFPDIDVKGAFIEPTINFVFDMQVSNNTFNPRVPTSFSKFPLAPCAISCPEPRLRTPHKKFLSNSGNRKTSMKLTGRNTKLLWARCSSTLLSLPKPRSSSGRRGGVLLSTRIC